MTSPSDGRPAFAADFRVGAWLVEPSLDLITRDGQTMRLRPQLIDLLVLLARHAGQTISKDTILANVWAGQHVAESGLTRCIAEIRQALGDDADEPTVIQTIPKRGYRLVAPVMFLDRPPASDVAPDVAPDTRAAAEPPVPAPESSGPLPEAVTQARMPRPLLWTAGATVAASLVLVLALTGAGWTRSPDLTGRDSVLLADVVNTTGDRAFDGTLRLALAVHLGQAPFLRILSDEHMRAAAVRAGRSPGTAVTGPLALDVCRREGAAVVLAASIAPVGTHYAVGIEAVGCRTGEPLSHELVDVARKEEVLSAFGAAASRVRQALGESRASLREHDVPIVEGTTPSLDALRAVTAGDDNRDHARPDAALEDYRRATDLDPQFALAWARRGAAARNLGLNDEAVLGFRRAYDLRERVSEPERFYILGHYYRNVADEPEKAAEIYRTWQRVYPGSAVPPTNLASLSVNVFGRYAEAVTDAREAVRLAPYSAVAARLLVFSYLGSNRIADARQALRDAAQRGISDVTLHELAFQIAAVDADAPAMEAEVRWSAGRPAAAVTLTWNRALAAAVAGRLTDARRLWREAEEAATRLLPPVRQARIRLWEAEAEALLGDPARARQAADAAVALHPQPATLLDAATSLALAGDTARAGVLIDQAVKGTEPGICSRPVWLFVSRALVASRSGRAAQAAAEIAETARFERGREWALAPLGARALVASRSGRQADAAAAYRQVLELRPVLPLSPWVAVARVGLARALRDAGDAAASRAAYDAALAGLAGADADAPLLAAARAERAALDR